MALSRRTGARFQASIWPGFVDAMTGLLLVLMFVLTIFMVVQFVLRETISGQETQLDALSAEVAALAQALGLEQDKSTSLTERVGVLTATLSKAQSLQQQQEALITSLQSDLSARDQALSEAEGRIVSFEEQVAGLLAARDTALGQVAELETQRNTLMSEQEALQLTLADMRTEIDARTETARLAAAKREALNAMIADLRRHNTKKDNSRELLAAQVTDLEARLTKEEKSRLAEAAAAEALREKLKSSQAELTAMTLGLEEQRKQAEDTLTLLAAAQSVEDGLNAQLAAAILAQETTQAQLDNAENQREQLAAALAAKFEAETQEGSVLSDAEENAALLSVAREKLAAEQAISREAQRQQALLNQQVAALRTQLQSLQGVLNEAKSREAAADVQLQNLGRDLNTALARVAAEERKRRELEEEERKRLEAENVNLEQYRSEFFGRLRDVLGAQEGVRIVGDRFVFSSEVLFDPGQARLSADGQREITKVAEILRNVVDDIPVGIDWILRVDGHTDDVPLTGTGRFADNWELSQARALSVVRYMIDYLGMPPSRLSANGFGQFQPLDPASTAEARNKNRRIELKFTER